MAVGLSFSLAGGVAAQENSAARPDSDSLLRACDRMPECRGHLDRADRFYERHHYEEALGEYQAAYRLQPYPLILFNLARLHHKQRHWREAIEYYQLYLATEDPQQASRARQLLSETQTEQNHQAMPQSSSRSPGASGRFDVPGPRVDMNLQPSPGRTSSPAPRSSAHSAYPRPLWRIITGGFLLSGGFLSSVFGAAALGANGHCLDPLGNLASCSPYYNTGGIGTGLLVSGTVELLAGALMIVIPETRPRRNLRSERSTP